MGPGPCPTCGFDPSRVSPADAAVAVRSYPRRFRALLVRPDDDGEPTPEDLVRRRPPEGGWSALEHAAWVAGVLSSDADALDAIRVRDIPPVSIDPAESDVATAVNTGAVLDRMAGAADRLAQSIAHVGAPDWKRLGRLPDGEDVTALDVARHAVHQGAHHLRETERLLSRLRGRT